MTAAAAAHTAVATAAASVATAAIAGGGSTDSSICVLLWCPAVVTVEAVASNGFSNFLLLPLTQPCAALFPSQ